MDIQRELDDEPAESPDCKATYLNRSWYIPTSFFYFMRRRAVYYASWVPGLFASIVYAVQATHNGVLIYQNKQEDNRCNCATGSCNVPKPDPEEPEPKRIRLNPRRRTCAATCRCRGRLYPNLHPTACGCKEYCKCQSTKLTPIGEEDEQSEQDNDDQSENSSEARTPDSSDTRDTPEESEDSEENDKSVPEEEDKPPTGHKRRRWER